MDTLQSLTAEERRTAVTVGLGTLAFTDFYIWMVSSGVITDFRFIG